MKSYTQSLRAIIANGFADKRSLWIFEQIKIDNMKKILDELRLEYHRKFTALIKVAEIFENEDQDVFMKCLKKAAGCKLMLEQYDRQLSILSSEKKTETQNDSELPR